MKSILFILFLLISASTQAQKFADPTLWGSRDSRRIIDYALGGPTGCGAPTSLNAPSQKATDTMRFFQYFDSCNHRFYVYDPKLKIWDTIHVGPNGGTGIASLKNLGTGYKLAKFPDSIKSLKPSFGIKCDSSISGELSLTLDTFNVTRYYSNSFVNQESWLNYNTPISASSFTDSALVNELQSANTPYFNRGIVLKGSYSGDIKDSRLLAWNYGYIIDNAYSQKIIFQVLDSSADLSIGLGVDCKQVIGSSNDAITYLTGTLGGTFTLYNIGPGQSYSTTGLSVNKGDIVILQFNQYYDSVVVYFNNLTNGSSGKVVRKVGTTTLSNYKTLLGYPTLYFAKGHVSVLNFSVTRQDFDYVFLGNSITDGYRANSFDSSFVGQLRTRTASKINNASRAAATSSDYLKVKEGFNFSGKVVFLSGVFGNDAYAGIDSFATKANYDTIVNRLRRHNNRIIHITNTYRTTFLGADGWPYLLAENNWIRRNYTTDTVITVDSIVNTGTGYADGTHLNQSGNNTIFNKIYSTQHDLFERYYPSTGGSSYSLAIGNSISGGAAGRILFQGTGGILQSMSTIVIDSTNGRVGIGTSSPAYTLHANGKTYLQGGVDIGTTAFGDASAALSINSSASTLLGLYTSGGSPRMMIDQNGSLNLTGGIGNISAAGNFYTLGTATIGASSGNSTLSVSGSASFAYTSTTSNLTLDATHYYVKVPSGSPTITLPSAVGIAGRTYSIKNAGAGTVTIATTSSQTIDGTTPPTLTAGMNLEIYSDNANWQIK